MGMKYFLAMNNKGEPAAAGADEVLAIICKVLGILPGKKLPGARRHCWRPFMECSSQHALSVPA